MSAPAHPPRLGCPAWAAWPTESQGGLRTRPSSLRPLSRAAAPPPPHPGPRLQALTYNSPPQPECQQVRHGQAHAPHDHRVQRGAQGLPARRPQDAVKHAHLAVGCRRSGRGRGWRGAQQAGGASDGRRSGRGRRVHSRRSGQEEGAHTAAREVHQAAAVPVIVSFPPGAGWRGGGVRKKPGWSRPEVQRTQPARPAAPHPRCRPPPGAEAVPAAAAPQGRP